MILERKKQQNKISPSNFEGVSRAARRGSLFLLFPLLLFPLLLSSCLPRPAQPPKYIFLFIGDGFGTGTLTYSEIVSSENGETLVFSQFPVTGLITTHPANDWVPCSAAAVTALASGEKTNNYMLNVTQDSVHILTPISKILREKGYGIGVATTVSIDHATPAGFYAHSIHRTNYYDIARQLTVSGFHFFAGAGFRDPNPEDSVSIFTLLKENDYVVSTSIASAAESKSLKNILIQPQGKDNLQLPYAVNKNKDDFTLAQITQLGIEKLSAPNKPFFFMIEGGLIDWAAHDNLATALYGEVKEFSEAIEVALAFYKKHPKETLIIVTADHETGGAAVFSDGLDFLTGEHTGNIVPVFAIGAGAENFSGLYDNTKVMKKMLHLFD